MTEEARRVFVNTIVYMKRFDGAKQTVWRGVQPRAAIPLFIEELRQLSKLPEDKDRFSERLNSMFPPEVVKAFGEDVDKYRELYQQNVGYVYVPHGATWYTVDEEAKSIGVPNNDVRFLEKCIDLLRQRQEAAKATRLLERYTGVSFPSAKGWLRWFKNNRNLLYFSDYYDYRFYAGPAGPRPSPREVEMAIDEIKLTEPDEHSPVSLGAVAVGYVRRKGGTYSTRQGALVTLIVKLEIANGWHTYAQVTKVKRMELRRLSVELPASARWYGDWLLPTRYPGVKRGAVEGPGFLVFTRQLYFPASPIEGKPFGSEVDVTLGGTAHYQACKEKRCVPAADMPFEGKVSLAKE